MYCSGHSITTDPVVSSPAKSPESLCVCEWLMSESTNSLLVVVEEEEVCSIGSSR